MAGAVANPAMKATVDEHFDLFMRSYAPAEIEKETLTAEQLEEYEARAKEYSKMKMAQHRAWQKDIAGKIRHKLVAIKSLPEGFIRDAAAAPDYSSFSMKRTRPSLTPAIPGFYEAKQEKAEKVVTSKRKKKTEILSMNRNYPKITISTNQEKINKK